MLIGSYTCSSLNSLLSLLSRLFFQQCDKWCFCRLSLFSKNTSKFEQQRHACSYYDYCFPFFPRFLFVLCGTNSARFSNFFWWFWWRDEAPISTSVYNVGTRPRQVWPRQGNEGSRIPAAQSLTLRYARVEYTQCFSAHTPTEIPPHPPPPPKLRWSSKS